jgi:mono/diheme cytochrome c family protein
MKDLAYPAQLDTFLETRIRHTTGNIEMGNPRPFIAFILLLAFMTAACGGLSSEPRIVATIPSVPEVQEAGFPLTPPDLALGAQVFAANCTRCHGASGRGDGPLIGDGPNLIANRPPDFTSPATTQDQTPLAWFTTITDGRLDRLMPPWRDALSETERWAAAMYTYTLHYTAAQLEEGQALWESRGQPLDRLPAQDELVNLTDAQLLALLLPDAATTLSPEEQTSVAGFLRTQTLRNADFREAPQVAAVTTPEAAATEAVTESASISVTGRVTNGTAGGVVPGGLTVTLHAFDPQFADTATDTALRDDGTFVFEHVEMRPDWTYVASVKYQDRVFGSELVPGDPELAALDLPVPIYELSSDPANIRISAMVTQISALENTLEVAQVVSFTNISDRLYTTDESFGEDRFGSVRLPLPPGAQILSLADNQQRYAIAPDGSVVIDTAPVLPGDGHVMHLIYSLPYNGDFTLEQPIPYAVEGQVRFLTSPESLTITSDQVIAAGSQTVGGSTYRTYDAAASIPAGSTLRLQFRGGLGAAESPAAGSNLLSVIMIVIGIAVLLMSVLLYVRERNRPKAPAGQTLMDALVVQIAELDVQHEAGELADDVYKKRRTQLKARLAKIIDQK